MATREGKTPRKAGGGRFNTIETSTPSKGRPPAVVKPISVRPGGGLELAAAANHSVQTPKRGGALFNNASPMVEGQSGDEHAGSSTIKVFVRVRPMSSSEKSTGRTENVVSVPTTDTVVLQGSEPKPFTFDYVADSSTTQNEVFDMIGRPFTDSCLKGYNGCIFAYGQTGSGKTFTMQGPDAIDTKSEDRGLIPRTFEYLFERIAAKEAMANATKPGSLQFIVRCCYMEIYNETVTDLLEASKSNLAVRENNKDGIYVDGITWQEVRNAEACVALLERGLRNRKVGETSMNKESSRSHSLLTVRVESTRLGEDGLTKRRSSSLNLVDLAGSERQKAVICV
jgi:kinesin family protein 15